MSFKAKSLFSDGLQALEQAKLLRPDLIIMDVFMPNMNGIDATRIIALRFPLRAFSSSARTILQFYVGKLWKPTRTAF